MMNDEMAAETKARELEIPAQVERMRLAAEQNRAEAERLFARLGPAMRSFEAGDPIMGEKAMPREVTVSAVGCVIREIRETIEGTTAMLAEALARLEL